MSWPRKSTHEEDLAKMRERYERRQKRSGRTKRKRQPLPVFNPPPLTDPAGVIANVKKAAFDFCARNCSPKTGHHVGCVFLLWDDDGNLIKEEKDK